jgi:hypothetical protein
MSCRHHGDVVMQPQHPTASLQVPALASAWDVESVANCICWSSYPLATRMKCMWLMPCAMLPVKGVMLTVTTVTTDSHCLNFYAAVTLQTYTDPKTSTTTVLANACNPSFMMCYNTAASSGRRLLQNADTCKVYNPPSTTPTITSSECWASVVCRAAQYQQSLVQSKAYCIHSEPTVGFCPDCCPQDTPFKVCSAHMPIAYLAYSSDANLKHS